MKRQYTKRECIRMFREYFPQHVGKCEDKPARDQDWNNWVDSLIRSGEVSNRAYKWVHPFNK